MSVKLSKDISEIRAGLFERIEAVQDDYAAKGYLPARLNLNKGIARGIIELFAWGLWQLYNFLDVIHKQAIPLEATGEWLDTHAAQVDESRKSATKARGNVLFLRGDGTGNIRIPAGRIVRTLPDGKGDIYRYVTDELAVLPEGSASVSVSATAEEYGQGANASAGQICELVTPVEGIAGVTNAADWLLEEGADEENDASLRRRYVLAWQSKAGVTRAAYEAAALSVPGVVDVYVADQADAIVINHDLLVRAPEPVKVQVRAVLELLSGDADSVKAEAESWVRSMFSYGDDPDIPRFSIGKDVVRDRLASGIVSISGVKRIRWESPAEDVEIPAGGLAVLEALDLQTVWVAEE